MTARILVPLALALAALVLIRPVVGQWRRWRHAQRVRSRILAEDALKHVQESGYRGRVATLQSLAGALEIGVEEATSLAAVMEARGLLRTAGEGLAVTPPGREYALQVIRAHRLWERHLADETGTSEAAWHAKAERREHRLTPAQTDELAARLGHPRFDPHGDPIPTAHGDIPDRGDSFPLSELPAGRAARVVHLEDEPAGAYARMVAAGLHVGSEIRVLAAGADGMRFLADGDEVSLPPVIAAGVSVVEIHAPDSAGRPEHDARLSELEPGDRARIVSISRGCRGVERRRLMDLGVIPGTEIEAILKSPSGDPTAYRLRDTTIAIRRRQAERIRVRRVPEEAAS